MAGFVLPDFAGTYGKRGRGAWRMGTVFLWGTNGSKYSGVCYMGLSDEEAGKA